MLCAPTYLKTQTSQASQKLVNDPSMHHGTCVTHARAVMHMGFANPCWRGKSSQYSPRMRKPQFYVSGKKPIMLWCCFGWWWWWRRRRGGRGGSFELKKFAKSNNAMTQGEFGKGSLFSWITDIFMRIGNVRWGASHITVMQNMFGIFSLILWEK